MTMRHVVAVAALGGALGLAVAEIALAYAGYTTGDVNVRTGPSTAYQKISTLARGTPVDIRFCQPSWCEVAYWGGVGWVSAGYLSVAARPPVVVQPGAGFYFRFGSPVRRWPPGPPPPYFDPWPDPRPWW